MGPNACSSKRFVFVAISMEGGWARQGGSNLIIIITALFFLLLIEYILVGYL